MKTRILLLIALLLLCLQVGAAPVSICSDRPSVFEELNDSTAVFSGRAIAEEYWPIKPKDNPLAEGGEVLVVRFAVERWWKGSGDEEVLVYTGVERYPGDLTRIFSEDFKFSVGKEYLVFAFGSDDELRTNVCRRTVELEKAEEVLQQLGQGNLPEKKQ